MDDKDAVVAAVKDYWEGWFDGDAGRMERALHSGLTKSGVDSQTVRSMTAGEMIGWTRDGIGVAEKPADFAYDITINDIFDGIATVTVHSAIYREYLHLVKTADGWRILNALYARLAP